MLSFLCTVKHLYSLYLFYNKDSLYSQPDGALSRFMSSQEVTVGKLGGGGFIKGSVHRNDKGPPNKWFWFCLPACDIFALLSLCLVVYKTHQELHSKTAF